jgi:lipoprotein-anchoring transpeptidase ErfK/SrfK
MGRNARRAPAARAAVAAALAAVVATVLLGLGYAQATPQLTAPGLPPAPAAAPARPVERTPADEPDAADERDSDADDTGSSDGVTGDTDASDADRETPGRLRAAAPHAPQPTPHRAAPPADSSEPAGSKPTGHAAPSGPSGVAGTPCTATARACVALDDRLAWLLDGGNVVAGPIPIQHGDDQDPTPRGTFKVQWKAEQYTSREYLTQMPYSVFFADGGIAFHEGTQDTPSAGCVKLGHEDAESFFYFLQVGDEVQIH